MSTVEIAKNRVSYIRGNKDLNYSVKADFGALFINIIKGALVCHSFE